MVIEKNQLEELAKISGGIFAVKGIDEAFDFCKKIALGHYENFPVGSILISKKLRKHFFSIYAFARIADDIADELSKIKTKEIALQVLDEFNSSLNWIYDNKDATVTNPIFFALRETIHTFNIPKKTFEKLIIAFKSDINFTPYKTFQDVLDYCDNSANPIGELLLRLHNEYNEENLILSNYICSGLQLINFWQDLSIDLKRNRSYIPLEISQKYVKLEDNEMLKELIVFTREMMKKGEKLLQNISNFRFRVELAMIISGGNFVLKEIEKLEKNIFEKRPKIRKNDLIKIFYNAIVLLIDYPVKLRSPPLL